jgi:hypothetical protein
MHVEKPFNVIQWFLTILMLFGMVSFVSADSCEKLGQKGPHWVTIDGTWTFVEGIEHIPPFPTLNNNVIRLRPYTTTYGLEGWHTSALSVTPTSDFIPPAPGVLIEEGFATFVGVMGKVTQHDVPVIEPEDIIAQGAFLAPFQQESVEFDKTFPPPVINGEIHYSKGTLGFEGIHGTLTFNLDPTFFPASGPWVGCFHVPFSKTFKKLVD